MNINANTSNVDKKLLDKAIQEFADEFEGRYEFYRENGRGPNDHQIYGKSDHVFLGRLRIALIAQGAGDLGDQPSTKEQIALREQIAALIKDDWQNESEYFNAILESELLRGNKNAKRIARTEAQFILMNTKASPFMSVARRVFGEIAGVAGHTRIRDEIRSLPETRAKAQDFLDNTPL